jgi:diaminopimelate epimerase
MGHSHQPLAAGPADTAVSRNAAIATARRFSKMHGAGNDFVVLDLRKGAPPPSPTVCRAMADRHTGVGCDQLLTIEAPRTSTALASYRIWNADGSPSQQCGNGARCVAAWLVREVGSFDGAQAGRPLLGTFELDSPAGTHAVEVLGGDRYRIAMGVPQFAPQAIPLAGFVEAQDEYAIELVIPHSGGERSEPVRFGAVSIGNPHVLIEVADVDRADVALLGPRLQAHGVLPQSGNIGFAEVVARDRIRLRVYERGVGETLACGSGACAAVAVLARRGRVGRDVTVALPGGELHIAWPEDTAEVSMAGPAAFVYEGEWLQ